MNSHLYIQWDKEDSDEPQGCYLAKITWLSSGGTATVLYRNGKMLETINLSKTNWFPAPENGKWYLPSSPFYSYCHKYQVLQDTQSWRICWRSLCSPLQWKTMQQLSKLLMNIACPDLDLTWSLLMCPSSMMARKCWGSQVARGGLIKWFDIPLESIAISMSSGNMQAKSKCECCITDHMASLTTWYHMQSPQKMACQKCLYVWCLLFCIFGSTSSSSDTVPAKKAKC